MKLQFIIHENTLPKIRISNTDFLIDGLRREFRDVNNPHNTIPFGKLTYDEGLGGYELLFDKLTRNKYDGYLPQSGIPPMTERVFIPRLKEMEQTPAQDVTHTSPVKKDMHEVPKTYRQHARKSHTI